MPAKSSTKVSSDPVKECCRLIRLARNHRKAHRNSATRLVRAKALAVYVTLSETQKDKIPQELRVWLRYRSEKYFGEK